jgi:CheY-like chemotaxis protein
MSPEPAQAPTPKRCRVLLIEDHADTRDSLTILLTRRGHLTLPAANCHDARQIADAVLASRMTIDLIIGDVGLPDGDGVALMAELKDRLGCPAIALTGHGMGRDLDRCTGAGIECHLLKPVGVGQLEAQMRRVAAC